MRLTCELTDEVGAALRIESLHRPNAPCIDISAGGSDWKDAMRQQASSVREVLARQRWALGVMESRVHPGPANMRYHDTVIRALRQAGFSVEMAIHAFTVLDSFIFGFALEGQTLPFEGTDQVGGGGDRDPQPVSG